MKKILEHLGNVAASLGVSLCSVAGYFYFAGFELISLFVGGMGLMLGACLAKLHVLGMAEP